MISGPLLGIHEFQIFNKESTKQARKILQIYLDKKTWIAVNKESTKLTKKILQIYLDKNMDCSKHLL